MAFEHYRRLFYETRDMLFYINSLGYIERYKKINFTQHGTSAKFFERVSSRVYERKDSHKKEIYLTSVVNHKRFAIKRLVAQNFSSQWEKGSKIYHKDGNIKNCNIENLLIYSHRYQPPTAKRGKAIAIKIDGKWKKFKMIKEAAEYMNVSLASLKRHIAGNITHPEFSVIEKLEFYFIDKK